MVEEGERLLALFDSYWFGHDDLPKSHRSATPAHAAASEPESRSPAGSAACQRTPHQEVPSSSSSAPSSSESALLARRPPRLCTIPSGKLTPEEGEDGRKVAGISGGQGERRPARKTAGTGRKSRSLSELQFEELKGIMDLGFSFSAVESDQRLLSIVPGLRRMGSSEDGVAVDGGAVEEAPVTRPYLSEAWAAVEDRRSHARGHRLRTWKIPAPGDGVDMKHHLRHWAHSVASAIR